MAFTVPWLLVGCVGNVVLAYDLHVADILNDGATLEEYVGDACKAEVSAGTVVGATAAGIAGGGAGLVTTASACAVQATVVAAGTLAAATLDLGLWVGLGLISALTSGPHLDLVTRQVERAPAALLKEMEWQLNQMKTDFKAMQEDLVNMTQEINKGHWAEVAAKSTLVLAKGKRFALAMKLALKRGGCTEAIAPTVCKPEYYICYGDGCTSTGCLVEPFDCYSKCCEQQQDWCHGDDPCLRERGCGKGQVHPPSFQTQNCHLLQVTEADFLEANTNVQALHDCACELKGDFIEVKGCGAKFEKQVRQTVVTSMNVVKTDLDSLSKLYQDSAAPAALVAMVSSATVAQNRLALACKKASATIPQCSVSPAPTPGPGSDHGSASTVFAVWPPLVSMVLLVVYLTSPWLRSVVGTLRKHSAESEHDNGTSQPEGRLRFSFLPCQAGDLNTSLLGSDVRTQRGGWCCILGAIILAAIVILQFYQAVLLASRSTPTAAPLAPTAAPLAPSMECLASHVVQQIFDTCQDALGIVKAAQESGAAMSEPFTELVETLASDFPDLVNVALSHSP